MDFYKFKWKMKFRMKKAKGFVKLCEYRLRKKFHLEGDEGFYYHLQTELMEDLVKADPEQEYLEEHGLLPEEPKPESEPEPEKEPGLIRELGFMELMFSGAEYGENTYMATELKEYEDRIFLKVSRVDNFEVHEYEFTLPRREGEPYLDVTLEGKVLRFDLKNLKFLEC